MFVSPENHPATSTYSFWSPGRPGDFSILDNAEPSRILGTSRPAGWEDDKNGPEDGRGRLGHPAPPRPRPPASGRAGKTRPIMAEGSQAPSRIPRTAPLRGWGDNRDGREDCQGCLVHPTSSMPRPPATGRAWNARPGTTKVPCKSRTLRAQPKGASRRAAEGRGPPSGYPNRLASERCR